MTIRTKRVLYVSMITLFLLVAPLVLLYATGYRLSPHTLSYEKVGAFFIKSYPADATITVEGIPTGERTPGRLLNMAEGIHHIVVSREGYSPWSKNLPIVEGETTFVETIQLLKEIPLETILSSGGRGVVVSPDAGSYAFINGSREIVITNTQKATATRVVVSVTPHTLLAIAPTNDKLIFGSGAAAWILDINTERLKPVRFIRRPITKVLWDPQNTSLLWLQSGDELFSYDIAFEQSQLRFTNLETFSINSTGLALLYRENIQNYLFELHDALTLETRWSQSVAAKNPALVAAHETAFAVVQDSANTYLITPESVSRHKGAFYGIKKNSLLLYDGLEVTTYTITSHESDLIDRSTEPIHTLVWHPSGDYILLHQDSSIRMLELDRRGNQQRIAITSERETGSLLFSPNGSHLFVVTPTTNRTLEIQ